MCPADAPPGEISESIPAPGLGSSPRSSAQNVQESLFGRYVIYGDTSIGTAKRLMAESS